MEVIVARLNAGGAGGLGEVEDFGEGFAAMLGTLEARMVNRLRHSYSVSWFALSEQGIAKLARVWQWQSRAR